MDGTKFIHAFLKIFQTIDELLLLPRMSHMETKGYLICHRILEILAACVHQRNKIFCNFNKFRVSQNFVYQRSTKNLSAWYSNQQKRILLKSKYFQTTQFISHGN